LQFIGKPWDPLRNIPVDRESSFTFSLRPALTKYRNRLLCEVSVHENTKVVTFRSVYGVENLSLYPLELILVNEIGQPVCSPEKLGKIASLLHNCHKLM
jgi:vacuolar protein sorting-associated protein 13A/C